MIRVSCLGAAGTVTGSCYLIESPAGRKILVDCGLFQGNRELEERNTAEWGFDPAAIQVLFLTHAHIDHSGRIPKLVKDGFSGRIITSPPTAELCSIMLLDSAHVQEMDAEWQSRKNRRVGRRAVEPLYTKADAEASLKHLVPIAKDRVITVDGDIKARLRNAGHILGSSILELWLTEEGKTLKIVFSGDLGKRDQLIVEDPQEIFDADYLFVESTYGNRRHRGFEESKEELLEAIRYSQANGEKVMIPAFAVERTQEILYVLGEFHREGRLPDMPIFLDSPLAIQATEIFKRNSRYYDEQAKALVEKGQDPLALPTLRYTLSTRESMAINETPGAAIVIAGNGMCTGGRIRHHLKHNLWRKGASLVIVGFQGRGSTGRQIVDGAKQIRLLGETVAVRARVFTIGGFSAHADQEDLLDWVSHFESRPKVFVTHGEPVAGEALAEKLRQRFGLDVHLPRWKERLVLLPRGVMEEAPGEEAPPGQDTRGALLTTLGALEETLRGLREKVAAGDRSPGEGESALDRLRYIQAELKDLLA